MLTALLGPWRYLLYAGVIAAFIGGLVYAKGQYDEKQQAIGAAPYILAIEKQKSEAAILIQAETEKAAAITKLWADYARSSENDYEKKIAAIRNTSVGNGLYDPGTRRWQSSNCPTAGSNNPPTPKETADSTRLSGSAEQFLYAQAKRADEVAEYAMSCFEFVNRPTVKEQVNKLRGTQ